MGRNQSFSHSQAMTTGRFPLSEEISEENDDDETAIKTFVTLSVKGLLSLLERVHIRRSALR